MKKVILAIMDGVGCNKDYPGNAFKLANTPNLDMMLEDYNYGLLKASGEAVGLPKGQMGNSEVGHLTIGAGRVVFQPLEKINQSIKSGEFYKNEEILKAFSFVKENNSRLHIFGMLSDGGVHSHIKHIFALLDMAKKAKIEKVYLHVFLDGRDTLPNVALEYLDKLKIYLLKVKNAKIATVSGRYYAMDRDGCWENVKMAYDAMALGVGKTAKNYQEVIVNSYKEKIYDEFVVPTILDKDGIVQDNDALIMANFRPDRITELFSAFTNPNFDKFDVVKYKNIKLVTMMPVSDSVICSNAFKHEEIKNSLGEVLAKNNLRVLRIAEYSKFPHVTHFIDGDKDIDYEGTVKVKIPRHDVRTYDLDPGMSSCEVTDYIEEHIKDYDVIIVNYANGDMVGHTGNIEACTKAMEVLDNCMGRLYKLACLNDFTLVVTADHGNCDEMLNKDEKVLTAHSLNPVYFIVCDKNYTINKGSLKDVAPTVLSIIGIDIPKEMTGSDLREEIL